MVYAVGGGGSRPRFFPSVLGPLCQGAPAGDSHKWGSVNPQNGGFHISAAVVVPDGAVTAIALAETGGSGW